MASNVESRADTVAWSFEQAPDEAYLGFSMASILAAIGLYMTGHRDNAFMVGILGPAFAMTAMMVKLMGLARSSARGR